MNNNPMPIVTKTPHIGIQRDATDSAGSTIEANLKKARRSLIVKKNNKADPLFTLQCS